MQLTKNRGVGGVIVNQKSQQGFLSRRSFATWDLASHPVRIAVRAATGDRRTSPPPVANHESPVTSLATLFHPWHAIASANIFSPISTGAKKWRAPSAFRRIPPCRSHGTINIAGSKLVLDTVR